MKAAEKIYELTKTLPEDQALQVFTFVESLHQKSEVQVEQNDNTEGEIEGEKPRRSLLSDYAGFLKGSLNFNEDPVELQRKMRDEWD